MTRETRIAMLVGLLFIVMFGLVLSELTRGTASPIPPQTLKNRIDDPDKHFAAVIEGGSLAIDQGRENPILLDGNDAAKEDEVAEDPCTPAGSVTIVVLPPSDKTGAGGDTHPEPLADTHKAPDAPLALMYVVKEKDNYIKIARAFYGAENEKAYVEIAKANQDQVKNEAGLRPGQKLVIPPVAGVKFAPDAPKYQEMDANQLKRSLAIRGAAGDPTKLAAVTPTAPVKDANSTARMPSPRGPETAKVGDPVKPAPETKTYEVRKGDSLGKIARLFLKSDSREAVQKLYKANPGLKAPDKLQPGMKLEIPS